MRSHYGISKQSNHYAERNGIRDGSEKHETATKQDRGPQVARSAVNRVFRKLTEPRPAMRHFPPRCPRSAGARRLQLDVVLDSDLLDQIELDFDKIDALFFLVHDFLEQVARDVILH
jgi:hypothetical protein